MGMSQFPELRQSDEGQRKTLQANTVYDGDEPYSRSSGRRGRDPAAPMEEEDDFNLVLRYNTRRNQNSQPVSLHIGGHERESNRNSVSLDQIRSSAVDRDLGEPVGGNPAIPVVDAESRRVAFPDDRFGYSGGHNSGDRQDWIDGSRNQILSDVSEARNLLYSSRDDQEIVADVSVDHLPKFFFHAFTSPVYSKEHVSQYIAGLEEWVKYVSEGVVPTAAKVDVFFRQLMEGASSLPVGRGADEQAALIDLPTVIQLYNKFTPADRDRLSAEVIADMIQSSQGQTAADGASPSLLQDVSQAILSLQSLNRSCRLGIHSGDTSQWNRYGEVDVALMQEITSIVKQEMLRLQSLEQGQLASMLRHISGTGHTFNIERLLSQCSHILLSVQSFLGSIVQSQQGHGSSSSRPLMSSSDCFEIISLCLLEVLWRLWRGYAVVLCLMSIVQDMVTQRVLAQGGSINDGVVPGGGKYAAQLPNFQTLREKVLNGDEESVLQVLQDFRSQHVNTAFQRFGR